MLASHKCKTVASCKMPVSYLDAATLVEQFLAPGDAESKLNALKQIKNAVIGKRFAKIRFIEHGIFPRLVELLETLSESSVDLQAGQLLIQASAIIGALAPATDDPRAWGVGPNRVEAALSRVLLRLVSAPDAASDASGQQLVVSVVRALAAVASALEPNALSLLAQPTVQQALVQLMLHPSPIVAEASGRTLAAICAGWRQSVLRRPADSGVVESFMAVGAFDAAAGLVTSSQPKVVEAALGLLAGLTWASTAACCRVAADSALVKRLLDLARAPPADGRSRLRVLSAACLAHCVLGASPLLPTAGLDELRHSVFAALHNCLPDVPAPIVLARLVEEDAELQALAGPTALPLLLEFVHLTELPATVSLEQVLWALACLTRLSEQNRQLVLLDRTSALSAALTRLLDLRSPAAVREATLELLRSVTRSVKTLRVLLLEPRLVHAVLDQMDPAQAPSLSLCVSAVAALCNLVLEFSPCKQVAVSAGAIDRLVALLALPADAADARVHAALRVNVVWSLQNLLYMAPLQLKLRLLDSLPWPALIRLTSDSDATVAEHAWGCVRNLCYAHAASLFSPPVTPGSADFDPSSADVTMGEASAPPPPPALAALFDAVHAQLTAQPPLPAPVLEQIGFLLSNLLASPLKPQILDSPLASAVVPLLDSSSSRVRVAALWCAINMAFENAEDLPTDASLLPLHQVAGFETSLRRLLADSDLDVKERARTCATLYGFSSAASSPALSPSASMSAGLTDDE